MVVIKKPTKSQTVMQLLGGYRLIRAIYALNKLQFPRVAGMRGSSKMNVLLATCGERCLNPEDQSSPKVQRLLEQSGCLNPS